MLRKVIADEPLNLLGLPTDILAYLFQFMTYTDVLILANNKRLYHLVFKSHHILINRFWMNAVKSFVSINPNVQNTNYGYQQLLTPNVVIHDADAIDWRKIFIHSFRDKVLHPQTKLPSREHRRLIALVADDKPEILLTRVITLDDLFLVFLNNRDLCQRISYTGNQELMDSVFNLIQAKYNDACAMSKSQIGEHKITKEKLLELAVGLNQSDICLQDLMDQFAVDDLPRRVVDLERITAWHGCIQANSFIRRVAVEMNVALSMPGTLNRLVESYQTAAFIHFATMPEWQPHLNRELFIKAITNGDLSIVNFFLKLNYSPNIVEHETNIPLTIAARYGHLPVMRALVKAGARVNPDTTTPLRSPMQAATAGRHFACMQFLLDHGADIHYLCPFDFVPHYLGLDISAIESPLTISMQLEDLVLMEWLLKRGASPNAPAAGVHLLTYLFELPNLPKPATLALLLKYGANANGYVETVSKCGSPLFLACAHHNPNIENIMLLLRHKANPNLARADGATPFLIAAQKGQYHLARLLLEYGADKNALMNSSQVKLRNIAGSHSNKALLRAQEFIAQQENQDDFKLSARDLANILNYVWIQYIFDHTVDTDLYPTYNYDSYQFFDMACAHPHLSFTLCNLHLLGYAGSRPSLPMLSLDGFGVESFGAFASAVLTSHRNLQTLVLRDSLSFFMSAYLPTVNSHTPLTALTIKGRSSKLQNIELINRNLQGILTVLPRFKKLTRLKLYGGFDEQHFDELAHALIRMKNLQHFSLYSLAYTPEAYTRVLLALRGLPLQSLTLINVRVNPSLIREFCATLATLPRLEKLVVKFAGDKPSELQSHLLMAAIQGVTRLKKLRLYDLFKFKVKHVQQLPENLPLLKSLTVQGVRRECAEILAFSHLPLETLVVHGEFTNDLLEFMAESAPQWSQLTTLSIHQEPVFSFPDFSFNDQAIEILLRIIQSLPRLKRISINNCLANDGLQILLDNLPAKIEDLQVESSYFHRETTHKQVAAWRANNLCAMPFIIKSHGLLITQDTKLPGTIPSLFNLCTLFVNQQLLTKKQSLPLKGNQYTKHNVSTVLPPEVLLEAYRQHSYN